MKRFINMFAFVSMLVIAVLSLPAFGQVTEVGNKRFTGDVTMDGLLKIDGSWYIDGTEVTATAANLNNGVASSTATQISNATLKVYGSELVITTNVTVPAGSIAAASIAAGTLANATILSNVLSKVYVSNVTALTSIVVPAGSIASASIAAGNMTSKMVISNATTEIMASNVVLSAGGLATILSSSMYLSGLPTSINSVNTGFVYVDLTDSGALKVK